MSHLPLWACVCMCAYDCFKLYVMCMGVVFHLKASTAVGQSLCKCTIVSVPLHTVSVPNIPAVYFHSAYPPILTTEMAVCMGWGNGLWSGSVCLIACVLLAVSGNALSSKVIQQGSGVCRGEHEWLTAVQHEFDQNLFVFVVVGTVEYWISEVFPKARLKDVCDCSAVCVCIISRKNVYVCVIDTV